MACIGACQYQLAAINAPLIRWLIHTTSAPLQIENSKQTMALMRLFNPAHFPYSPDYYAFIDMDYIPRIDPCDWTGARCSGLGHVWVGWWGGAHEWSQRCASVCVCDWVPDWVAASRMLHSPRRACVACGGLAGAAHAGVCMHVPTTRHTRYLAQNQHTPPVPAALFVHMVSVFKENKREGLRRMGWWYLDSDTGRPCAPRQGGANAVPICQPRQWRLPDTEQRLYNCGGPLGPLGLVHPGERAKHVPHHPP